MNQLKELLVDELADIYYAEKLLLKALPKMAKAAHSEGLRNAFEDHFSETENQVKRLEGVFKSLGEPAKAKKCDAMIGLLEEGKSVMEEWKGSPAVDAALISAAQKVEHYEIASYGCLCTWAKLLGEREALDLLKQTINEEQTTDQKLSRLAEEGINEEAETDMPEPRSKRRSSTKVKVKSRSRR
jgi:ferritin-like metal-binding protein YciE